MSVRKPPEDPREALAWWLRRAIRHCRAYGCKTALEASSFIWHHRACRDPDAVGSMDIPAHWLPERLRRMTVAEMTAQLAELEAEDARSLTPRTRRV